MKYITRFKFILGLSKYNEDDSVYEQEERIFEPFKISNHLAVLADMWIAI
jgi:hypothetical protein